MAFFLYYFGLFIAFFDLSAAQNNTGFATTEGTNFQVNGAPFAYAGTNEYDAAFRDEGYASDVVSAVVSAGYRVLRCWAFNEYDPSQTSYDPPVYFQSWSDGTPTPNTGPNGLGMLDAVVSEAEKQGLKLILTLTNNWDDYGGMDVYVNNTIGLNADHDLFYSDPQIQTYFKSYVSAVVSRYQDSSAIFAWDVANEARCSGTGPNPQSNNCTPSTITTWTDSISTYIKSIDSNHMVTTGYEGFYNWQNTTVYEYDGGSGQDFDALLALPNIDFATMHLYLTESYQDVAWSMQWLQHHEASGVAANKPVIQEEYGLDRSNQPFDRQTTYDQWHKFILSSKSINGDMTWASLVVDGDCPGDNEFAICESDPDYDDLVTEWSHQMNSKV